MSARVQWLIWKVAVDHMHFKNKMTPYEGSRLHGVVHQTWLRGHKIWDVKNGGHQGPPSGLMLLDERESSEKIVGRPVQGL